MYGRPRSLSRSVQAGKVPSCPDDWVSIIIYNSSWFKKVMSPLFMSQQFVPYDTEEPTSCPDTPSVWYCQSTRILSHTRITHGRISTEEHYSAYIFSRSPRFRPRIPRSLTSIYSRASQSTNKYWKFKASKNTSRQCTKSNSSTKHQELSYVQVPEKC